MKPAPGQQSLFGPARTAREEHDEPRVRLNPTVEEHERARLSEQHQKLVDALEEGPKTNVELGMICQRFSARLHELKLAGYRWTKRTIKPGIYQYTLH